MTPEEVNSIRILQEGIKMKWEIFYASLILLLALNAPAYAQVLFGPAAYGVGESPSSIFIADLDGDADNDFAVANMLSNTVSVLLNNGDGTFAPKVGYDAGFQALSVFGADLDGDGDNDLAATDYISNIVSVFLNNGDGTFAPEVDYSVGQFPKSVFITDLDGDGDSDLAVASGRGVSVLLNLSDIPITDSTAVTEYEEPSSDVPEIYSLTQNYPNPFNPQTVIYYDLPVQSHINISVYNITGQIVATLVDGHRSAGSYSLVWDGKDDNGKRLANGVYVYRLLADGFVKTRKMVLMR